VSKSKPKISRKKKLLNHIGKISVSIISSSFILSSGSGLALASDPVDAAANIVGSKGGKQALNEALLFARSKPALSVATGIVCLACPAVGVIPASPPLCIACGILIAKTFG
jgi:hypothetical protein